MALRFGAGADAKRTARLKCVRRSSIHARLIGFTHELTAVETPTSVGTVPYRRILMRCVAPVVHDVSPVIRLDMAEVTVRELRNDGGRVLDRVERGESLTVTRDGHAVAELRPLSRRPLRASALLSRWRRLAQVDAARLTTDIDAALDSSL
jgi:prevent-host-death family protein